MKTIPLTKGQVALVDDEDYERISAFKWQASETSDGTGYYARRMVWDGSLGRNRGIMMHAEVLGIPTGNPVDHEDRNRLNNQKKNLRPCTIKQNSANRKVDRRSRSGLKGVAFDRGKWRAVIRSGQKLKYLGRFSESIQAAMAYDSAAIDQWGEFALTNQKLGLIKNPCQQ